MQTELCAGPEPTGATYRGWDCRHWSNSRSVGAEWTGCRGCGHGAVSDQSQAISGKCSEGLRGVDAWRGSRGLPGVRSGATIKAEETFAQGLANQDFGQYYNRLAGLSSLG